MNNLYEVNEATIAMIDCGDDLSTCAECDPEVKCLFCGHRIAERPFEVYCNIMCKWVNEKDCCTMFEPGRTGYKCGKTPSLWKGVMSDD